MVPNYYTNQNHGLTCMTKEPAAAATPFIDARLMKLYAYAMQAKGYMMQRLAKFIIAVTPKSAIFKLFFAQK